MLVCLSLLFCVVRTEAEDWPTFQHDHHRTGYTTEQIDTQQLSQVWSWQSPDKPAPAWAGPAKWDAYAKIRDLPAMRNYDHAHQVIAAGNDLYFGSTTDDTMRCLDTTTGSVRWRYTCDGPIRIAASYDDGRLYFAADDGFAYCLDAQDGDLLWKFRPVEPDKLILNNGRLVPMWPIRTGVLVANQTAYFGAAMLPWKTSYLCALDAETGKPVGTDRYVKQLKETTLEGALAITSSQLVFPQGRIAPRLFRRFDGEDQGMLKGSSGGSIVVVAPNDRLLHGPGADSRKGAIKATDSKSREQIASYGRGNAMVVAGTIAYMLTDQTLIASDLAQRKNLWSAPCDCPHALIGAGNTLFAGGHGQLAAFSADDGKRIWEAKVSGKVLGLVVANGMLLASTDLGHIHAFSTTGPSSPPTRALPPAVGEQKPLRPVTPAQDAALLGRWLFRRDTMQGTTVRDQTGKRDATVLGNVVRAQRDALESLVLDGTSNSVMVSPDHKRMVLPKLAITVSAWVRVDAPQTWGGIFGAIQDNGSYERGWLLGYNGTRFSFAIKAKEGADSLTYLKAPHDFALRSWHHVAGTYDGQTARLFVDGQQVAVSTAQSGDIDYPPQAFCEIGAYHDKDEYFRLNGRLYETRIYRRALAADEIQKHFADLEQEFPSAPAPEIKDDEVAVGPYLRFGENAVATIRWQTIEPIPTILEYRDQGVWKRSSESQPKTQHSVVLSDLQYRRSYQYRIATNAEATRWTREFLCDTFFDYNVRSLPPAGELSPAHEALMDELPPQGLCFVVGCDDGQLIRAIVRRTKLRVIALDDDAERVKRLRQSLLDDRLYGARVSIRHTSSLAELKIVGEIADAMVTERPQSSLLDADECLRLLQPGLGQVVMDIRQAQASWQRFPAKSVHSIAENLTCIKRPADPGAGDWRHLYGPPNNSSFAGETLSGAKESNELQVQWIGRPGPRYQSDRSGRKPSPLSVAGRLFLQGDERIIAQNARNGVILWSLEVPGFQRYNMPRDCSNWCADDKHVYAAIRDRLWCLRGSDGAVERMLTLPENSATAASRDWGFIATVGDRLIGSEVKHGSSWTDYWGGAAAGWYDAKKGEVTAKVCSDSLFAIDKSSGKTLWQYRRGPIVNPTITINDQAVWFLESRHPEAPAMQPARLQGDMLWKDVALVCLDLASGKKRWEQRLDWRTGSVMVTMAESAGRLVAVCSDGGQYHVYCVDAGTGESQWQATARWLSDNHGGHMSRPAIVNGIVYVRPDVFELETGKRLPQKMSGFRGCGTYACTTQALFFRNKSVTMWNRDDGSSTTWARLRPDCWLSTIPAAGLLLSPEGGGGCSCGNWMETSIGFAPLRSLREK